MSKLTDACKALRDAPWFERTILSAIILAGILVGLETSPAIAERFHGFLSTMDVIILGLFILEIVIKMLAEGNKPWNYFKSGWNVFDFLIVAVCLIPSGGSWMAVARLARILRVLRLATMLEDLQIIVAALLKSIPSMGYVSLLLSLHFYIFAVAGVFIYRDNDPGHFGDLGVAFLTLFRVVTLEDWTDVMYTAIYGSDVYNAQGAIPIGPDPHAFGGWAALYFVVFVIIGAMVMVNLFIGVILTSITEVQAETLRHKLEIDVLEEHDAETMAELNNIEEALTKLRKQLEQKSS